MLTLEMGLGYKQQIQILLSSRNLQNFKKMNLYDSLKQHMWWGKKNPIEERKCSYSIVFGGCNSGLTDTNSESVGIIIYFITCK